MTDYLAQAVELLPESTSLTVIERIAGALEAAEKLGRVAGLREATRFAGSVDAKDFLLRRSEEVEKS